jgi:hypothetical protein
VVDEQLIVDGDKVMPPEPEFMFMKTTAAITTTIRAMPPTASSLGAVPMPARPPWTGPPK